MTKENRTAISEDWLATMLAFATVFVVLAGVRVSMPSMSWTTARDLPALFDGHTLAALGSLWIIGAATVVAITLLKRERLSLALVPGFTFIFLITVVAQLLTGLQAIRDLGLEIVLFSLLIGLVISNVGKVPTWVTPWVQTELYIKIGLVLLGCSIIFQDIVQAGSLGLLQSIAVVLVVWQFAFWIGRKFKLDDELRVMLSSAVAICGVSAAIATAGAIKGDGKKLSYVISLVLITAIPMMLIMPYVSKELGLPAAVAGAWLGGTIDTTGAVVAAGTLLGEEALRYATIVKFSQNVLLGIAAFAISLYWTYSSQQREEKPSLKTIWERFPKFVLGFVLVSLLFSFVLSPELVAAVKQPIKGIQTFWFALAFTCIGLETKFTDIFKLDNGRPAYAFLIAQLFNIVFTLAVAWLIFG
ncbi:MAG: putative sulfate exporter family transporter [Bacteroidia bacterium]|nr:putative sulfate exporter family transporter [Bacteroidia bacterium]